MVINRLGVLIDTIGCIQPEPQPELECVEAYPSDNDEDIKRGVALDKDGNVYIYGGRKWKRSTLPKALRFLAELHDDIDRWPDNTNDLARFYRLLASKLEVQS